MNELNYTSLEFETAFNDIIDVTLNSDDYSPGKELKVYILVVNLEPEKAD